MMLQADEFGTIKSGVEFGTSKKRTLELKTVFI